MIAPVIVTKVEPIERDIQLLISQELSPAAQSEKFAEAAQALLDEADETNKTVLGRIPPSKTFVDGHDGAPLDTVRPTGTIVREYELMGDVLIWIADQLHKLAPILTGAFRKSITVFADGAEVDVGGKLPPAAEFVFMSLSPYARKIEQGESKQAPDGIFEVVAAMARKRFANVARIGFAYRTAIGGSIIGGRLGNKSDTRNPAIIVTVR